MVTVLQFPSGGAARRPRSKCRRFPLQGLITDPARVGGSDSTLIGVCRDVEHIDNYSRTTDITRVGARSGKVACSKTGGLKASARE